MKITIQSLCSDFSVRKAKVYSVVDEIYSVCIFAVLSSKLLLFHLIRNFIVAIYFFFILGHMQQGGSPTPFDRNLGTKMGAKAVEWFTDQLRKCTSPDGKTFTETADSAVMLGIVRRQYRYTPFLELMEVTDFEWVSC